MRRKLHTVLCYVMKILCFYIYILVLDHVSSAYSVFMLCYAHIMFSSQPRPSWYLSTYTKTCILTKLYVRTKAVLKMLIFLFIGLSESPRKCLFLLIYASERLNVYVRTNRWWFNFEIL